MIWIVLIFTNNNMTWFLAKLWRRGIFFLVHLLLLVSDVGLLCSCDDFVGQKSLGDMLHTTFWSHGHFSVICGFLTHTALLAPVGELCFTPCRSLNTEEVKVTEKVVVRKQHVYLEANGEGLAKGEAVVKGIPMSMLQIHVICFLAQVSYILLLIWPPSGVIKWVC